MKGTVMSSLFNQALPALARSPDQSISHPGLGPGSSTKLWNRLSQHAGSRKSDGGNHCGSVFQLLVGEAIVRRENMEEPRSWGMGGDPDAAALQLGHWREQVKAAELQLERAVSRCICGMPFLFVAVDDEPGTHSHRGVIERAIGLLSNYHRVGYPRASHRWGSVGSRACARVRPLEQQSRRRRVGPGRPRAVRDCGGEHGKSEAVTPSRARLEVSTRH